MAHFCRTVWQYFSRAFNKQVGFPGGSDNKASAYNAGETWVQSPSGRSPREGNGNLLQYSCLENPIDRGALVGYSPWGLKGSDTTERLLFHTTNIKLPLMHQTL